MTTDHQRTVAARVISLWKRELRHYRAASNGERVTLASLFRSGVLARRCWRGQDGRAGAAYEYRPSNDLLTELGRPISPVAAASPVHVASSEVLSHHGEPPREEA